MSAPALVHLLRHGEPVLAGRMLGRTDADVMPAGLAACVTQTADLAATAIVSSDLRRAGRCAEAVAKRWELVPAVDPRWRELDFGDWDGLPADAVDGAALGRFWQNPDANPPPGGECWSALVDRVGAALAACGDGALVVTHAGAIRAALAGACGLSAAQAGAFDLTYAALVTLRLWRGEHPGAQIVRLRPPGSTS